MSRREVIAYAITHAPPGVKGGPYEAARQAYGVGTAALSGAAMWTFRPLVALGFVRRHVPHARVIRIVRKVRPSEASAVEVLRSFIAWADAGDNYAAVPLYPIEEAARRVLAASGPDSMPVVRDLVMLVAGELDYDLAKSLDPETAEEPEEAERCMRDTVRRVAEQFTVARKAGGK